MKIKRLKIESTLLIKQIFFTKRGSLLTGLLLLALNIAAFWQLSFLKKHYSLKQFQPKEHPQIVINEKVENQFLISDNNTYILSLSLIDKKQKWSDKKNLDHLFNFGEKFLENDNIIDVISLAHINTAVTDQESFTVGSVRELASESSNLENPLLSPHVISSDGLHAAIMIRPEMLSNREHQALLKEIKQETNMFHGIADIQLGGAAAITTEMTQLLSNELVLFTGLSLLLAIFILAMMFRGWMAPLISFLVVISANISGMAVMSLLDIPLTVLSNTLPILMTITVVAIVSHTLIRLSELTQDVSKTKAQWMGYAFKELSGAHLLTAITTAIGFATLIPSDVPIISQYGQSVACGVLIACLTSLVLLPVLLVWLPTPMRRQWRYSPQSYIQFLLGHKKPILFSIVSLAAVMAFFGTKLNWSSQLFDDLPGDHPTRLATEFADKNLGGTIPLNITIESPDKLAWKTPENLSKLAMLTEDIRRSGEAGSLIGLSDFIKMAHQQKTIPQNQKALSEMFFIYGMSSENPVDQFLTPNGQVTRLALRMEDKPSKQVHASVDRFNKMASHYFPDMKVEFSGAALTVHTINKELAKDLIYGFFTALLWIVLLLALVYRSFVWALFSVIPNLLPPIFLLGALALSNTPMKPGIALIFAISLGIAFDNTVYMLGRLKQLLAKQNDLFPLRELLLHELTPCLIASTSLMAGFSIFIFSYFAVNKLFGAFMLLSIGSGLLGDLVLLPVLLGLFPGLLSFKWSHVSMEPIARVKMFVTKKSVSLSVALFAVLFLGSQYVEAAKKKVKPQSANSIISKIQKNNDVPFEKAEIRMVIQERDGSKKERDLIIKKANGSESKALVKIKKPSDLKGVGLLSVKKGDEESQWLYLPSEKRSRRIVSSNKSGRFLDSDLSYEDLSVNTYAHFTNTIEKSFKKAGKNIVVLLSKAKSKQDTSYGKIKTWVDTKTSQILKAVYYDHRGKREKEMLFSKYKKYGKVWRAQKITVTNKAKRRSTVLEIKSISMKNINPGELSMGALEES